MITVNINSVLLDTFASGKAITLFPCCERIFGLKRFLKIQAIFPFPPDVVLVKGDDGFTRRGRTCGRRDIIVPDPVDTETITIGAAYEVVLAS